MTKKIKVIPATINPITREPHSSIKKRRVCGYARVSTDSDEQFTSYQAQIDYYTNFINKNPDWEFVGVYTDAGISGVNTKHRDGFNKMVADALEGKIDLIVTKSISRFARNTVDTLVTIRKLKEKGVECYFEKESIYTFDSKGELLITIMSSLAQEESRSISENVTWGHRKAFSDGRFFLSYSTFLGYRKGVEKPLEIIEEEAEIVRFIYRKFLDGYPPATIARMLEEKGVLSSRGGDKWYASTIRSILTNEKYKGDALLQKRFTVDFLTKKIKKNEGEVQQYYVENSHPAIIDPPEWNMVQIEMKRRNKLSYSFSGQMDFASRLVCADCGAPYGPKVWNSNDQFRRVVWQCNDKFKRRPFCMTAAVDASAVKEAFIKAYNELSVNRDALIADLNEGLKVAFNYDELDKEIEKTGIELEGIALLVQKLIEENSTVTMAQNEYQVKYESLEQSYNEKRLKYEELQTQKSDLFERETEMKVFIKNLENSPSIITEFDRTLWNLFVDKAVVDAKGNIKIVMKF